MNREQIENMPAGREMDALIAKEVMGLEVLDVPIVPREVFNRHWLTDAAHREFMKAYPDGGAKTVSHYSTETSAAWEVVEKLHSMGAWLSISIIPGYKTWDVRGVLNENTREEHRFINHAESAPLAICRAALLAVSS
jgi:hypothetical protein